MEREGILNSLDEQERWAASALSGVQESDLFGSPAGSDTEFLVRVRERIASVRTAEAYRPQFLPAQRVAWMASACVILLVAIISGPRFSREPMEGNGLADAVMMPTESMVDSLANAEIDPVELAQYLDVPEFVEEEVADMPEELPLTDQLMALDNSTLEEVLASLEDTYFF